MLLEAVIVCVDYADFLAITLPYTLPLVDSVVVVTTPSDKLTQRLCAKYSVRCLETDVFYRDQGTKFNKARGINHGLNHCQRRDWLIHMDADVLLPIRSRHFLQNAELQKDCIYGIDRVNCHGEQAWQKFASKPHVQYEWHYLVNPPRGMPLGSRIAHWDYGGYVPIGFFQLWHSSQRMRYPNIQHADAEHTDLLHAVEWSRPKRVLLPEIVAIHLCAGGKVKMGANWKGRTTAPFDVGQLKDLGADKWFAELHKDYTNDGTPAPTPPPPPPKQA